MTSDGLELKVGLAGDGGGEIKQLIHPEENKVS